MSVFLFNSIDYENFGNVAFASRTYLQVSSLDVWASTIYMNNKYASTAIFPVLASYVVVQTFVLLKYSLI
jgi:hypothetical protein